MLSPKTKRNILRIIPFGIIWLLSGIVFLIVEQAAAGNMNHPTTAIKMNLEIFIFSSLAITLVGLLVGSFEILYLNRRFAKLSFTNKILSKLVVYIILFFIITLTTYPIAASLELDKNIFDKEVWNKLFDYLFSLTHLSTDLQLGVALVISLFYSEISENIGHGILLNFFTGKYHSPIVEKRIFMFTDMKSSTTIAEKLGHLKYFELLKEYYDDFSDAIIKYGGEVYQYIGDEIVISWKFEDGIKDNNCIRCFFEMKEDLNKRAGFYQNKYGYSPTFKAGLHCGQVTTGEIGALKKEIIFTGDVLNSTARIQSLCNSYNVDILVSADLLNSLNLFSEYRIKSLGNNELRGKTNEVEIFTIENSTL